MFQFYNLVSNLTARENVELASEIVPNAKDATQTLVEVGLGDRLDNFPSQLSGGEQQRVAIARTLVTDSPVILADEPTGALDSKSTNDLLTLFNKINENGQTIIMVTHSTLAASHASRVLFIKDGEVFHQIYKGTKTNEEMYQSISDTLTLLATGGVRNE